MLIRPKLIDRAELEESQTGRELEPEAQEKADRERLLLAAQSEDIADRLERAGAPMRTGKYFVLGMASQGVSEKTAYRNCNMIPEVQARNTHGLMRSVQYWMDQQDPRTVRMWVFSSGWTSFIDYDRSHKEFKRFISKLHSDKLLKQWGISFAFYSVENTIKWVKNGQPASKGTPGAAPMLNLHAHVLVKCERFFDKKSWMDLLARVRLKAPKSYVHDSRLKKAAEIVKYVFKPMELNQLDDQQLAHLYTITTGKRFHTPLGELKRFRAELKEDGLKLKQIMTDKGKAEWRLYRPPSRDRDEKDTKPKPDMKNMVLGVCAPSPVFGGLYEPTLIVKDFTSWPAFLAANPLFDSQIKSIQAKVDQNRRYWRGVMDEKRRREAEEKAFFSSFIKDTTTITVHEAEPFEALEVEPGDDWLPPDDYGEEYFVDMDAEIAELEAVY